MSNPSYMSFDHGGQGLERLAPNKHGNVSGQRRCIFS